MEYINLQTTIKQHTVPQCYLKNFSEDRTKIFSKKKQVYTNKESLEKELGKPISIKKKATVEKDFYSVNNGREPMVIETLIYSNEIESQYPKVYKLLTDRTIQKFDMMERTHIFMCLLSLHCRTPKQFQLFFSYVNPIINGASEMQKVKEDYKTVHVMEILPNFIAAHEFKIIRIAKVIDNSEFITSDNHVLIIGAAGNLKNNQYREQFNIDNTILVPLDSKHCCILTNATDKNGNSVYNKLFYNKFDRIDVDCSFTQEVNFLMLESADKIYFGSEKYLKAYFNLWKFI